MKPTEALKALESFDQKWAKALREHGGTTVCHRGCSACCSEPCYTSRDEAELVVSKIPAAERAGVVARTLE